MCYGRPSPCLRAAWCRDFDGAGRRPPALSGTVEHRDRGDEPSLIRSSRGPFDKAEVRLAGDDAAGDKDREPSLSGARSTPFFKIELKTTATASTPSDAVDPTTRVDTLTGGGQICQLKLQPITGADRIAPPEQIWQDNGINAVSLGPGPAYSVELVTGRDVLVGNWAPSDLDHRAGPELGAVDQNADITGASKRCDLPLTLSKHGDAILKSVKRPELAVEANLPTTRGEYLQDEITHTAVLKEHQPGGGPPSSVDSNTEIDPAGFEVSDKDVEFDAADAEKPEIVRLASTGIDVDTTILAQPTNRIAAESAEEEIPSPLEQCRPTGSCNAAQNARPSQSVLHVYNSMAQRDGLTKPGTELDHPTDSCNIRISWTAPRMGQVPHKPKGKNEGQVVSCDRSLRHFKCTPNHGMRAMSGKMTTVAAMTLAVLCGMVGEAMGQSSCPSNPGTTSFQCEQQRLTAMPARSGIPDNTVTM